MCGCFKLRLINQVNLNIDNKWQWQRDGLQWNWLPWCCTMWAESWSMWDGSPSRQGCIFYCVAEQKAMRSVSSSQIVSRENTCVFQVVEQTLSRKHFGASEDPFTVKETRRCACTSFSESIYSTVSKLFVPFDGCLLLICWAPALYQNLHVRCPLPARLEASTASR